MNETVRLGDICNILNGYSFKSEKYINSGIRIIRITNVQKGFIEDLSPVYYPLDDEYANKYLLEKDDLLISLTGNVGRVAVISDEFLPAALNQRVGCIRITNNQKCYKTYLFHFLNNERFEKNCVESSKGVAQKNMSTEWLKDYSILLPDIMTQIHIAAVLNKVTDLIAKSQRQIELLDELVKARFVEMFGNPIDNSKKWETRKLGECLNSIDNGKSYVCANESRVGDNPAILKLSAVTYGIYRPDENKAMIDIELFDKNAEVKKYDLLFTRKNTPELVGMSAFVFNTPKRLMMPDLIFRFNAKSFCNKIYLWQLINHNLFRHCVQNISNGTAKSMSNISKERLSQLSIPVPPFKLQEKFADFVKQTEKSKTQIAKSLEQLKTLKKALMQKYFG